MSDQPVEPRDPGLAHDAEPSDAAPHSQPPSAESPDALVWEIDVPLLNNRMMMGGLARVFGVTALVMGLLMSFLFAVQGEFEAIPPILLGVLVTCGALYLVGLLSMLLIFRNKMRFRYTLTADGLTSELIDRTARATNRLAIVAGLLGRSPGTLGAGLTATSRESEAVDFSGAFFAQFRPRARAIVFRNAWRQLLIVYCTAENYDAVSTAIAERMRAHETASRVDKRSPLGRYLWRSLLVVLLTLPSFATVEAFDVSLLIPIILLAFGLTTVWLVNVFGWVVIVMAIVEIGAVVREAFSVHESFLFPGQRYSAWTVFSDDDWALIVLLLLSLGGLVWLSVRALRGRAHAALVEDYADMSGDE
jgi:hypothetical protein